MDDQHKTKQQLIEELAVLRQQGEERFRKIFEEGPIGVLLVGTDGRIQRANRRFCEMLGYSEGEIVALGLPGISHPDDWERDCPLVSRLWQGEISHYHVEKRYLRKDGQAVWGQLTVSLMHDEAGRPINTIGMVEDITERKQAEEKLQYSERTLRTLMDANLESIALMDTDGRTLLANATTAHRLGTTVDKIIGKTPKDLLPPEVADKRMRNLQEVVRTGKAFRFEDERLGRCMENSLHPILDEQGKVTAVAVLGIDRTEKKQSEEALQKAREELERRVEGRTAELATANENLDIFRKFVEASGEGFGMTDFDGCITYANPMACRLFGEEKPENARGKNVSAYYPEEYVRRRKTEMIPALLRKGHWHIEVTLSPRHEKTIQVLQSTFLIRDESGNPFRIAAVISDITERKQAQEALQREHRTLRHLLQSSDHERQTIAYEIHDGLAQYLAGAIMQFDAFNNLKESKPKQAVDAYHAAMTMLRQGHFEARRLISGVRPPILDEQGVVAAVDHLVNEERRKNGPRIEYLSKVEFNRLAPIMENAVYRIAQEALANACRHSRSKKIKVVLVQHGDQLRIEVQDQGVGFKLEDVEERQFGLSGIRERARLLGGQTTIESEPGKGTRIAVELPIVLRQG